MKYQKNRTESLTIRLTPAEKKMLQSRATNKHLSMTDYILLSCILTNKRKNTAKIQGRK
mgnify:CR=1 FL=1